MTEATPTRDSVIRNYEHFSFAALLVVGLILVERGSGLLSLIPFLIGLGGIAGRWRAGVPLFLMAVAFAVTCTNVRLFRRMFTGHWDVDPLTDWLLAAAVLGYAAAQCRLQGAAQSIVPADPRQSPKPTETSLQEPGRQADFVRELVLLGLALLIWAALAPRLWDGLPRVAGGVLPDPVWQALAPLVSERPSDELSAPIRDLLARIWRLVLLTWLLVLGTIIFNGLLSFLNRHKRRPDEALMFIQDLLWRETRGEQRRLFRWLAWARLRRERRSRKLPPTQAPP
jgi:hypothetical protein